MLPFTLPLLLVLTGGAEPPPPHPVLCRFPSPAVASACAESSLEHEKYCAEQLELASGPAESNRWAAEIRDAIRRRRAWLELCNCQQYAAGTAEERDRLPAALVRLKGLIGPAAWEGGAMVPPVPWWAAR